LLKNHSVPLCPDCSGVIKPDITFFGEGLPEETMMKAIELAESSDVMLVLGSSLTVYPAASLPDLCLKKGGWELIIVNQQPAILIISFFTINI